MNNMNLTKVKRYLVYKDKNDIDEFNISDPKSMDSVLFNFLEHSWLAGLADAPKLICSIFDTAHYIVTLIHLEAHPLLHIASYLDKADHVGADGPRFVHTHHLELRAATMGLVCNYLRVLSPEHLDVKAFLRAVHDQIEGSEPSTGARLSVHMVGAFKEPYDIFYEITHLPDIQSRTLLREDFRPRPIDEALEESNYEDIAENMAFIKLRIGQLSDEEQQLAKKIIQRVTKDTGEKALEGAMPEAAADVRKMMAKVAQEFGFELAVSKQQEENVDDSKGSQAIIKEQKKVIEDLKGEYQKKLNDEQRKSQELEKRVEELQEQISTSQSITTVEEMTIELFTYLFKEDAEETAKAFYKDIYCKDDPEIAEIVVSYKDKFAPRIRNCDIYRPLHAAKLYHGTDRNFDTALRNLKFR